MGLYATTTSIETYWVGHDFSNLTALASDCIDQAENEVRKRLSERYDVSSSYFQTTTSIPPMVRTLSLWLGLGYLYEANSRGSKDAYKRADRFINKAEKNLDKICEYKYNLVDSAGSAITDDSDSNFTMLSNTTDYTETFQEDDPLNWELDPDKINDISDSR